MRLIRNIRTLLTNRAVTRDYLHYWESRLRYGGRAVRSFPDGIKITELCNFSEFHSVGDFVSDKERKFLSHHSISSGAIIDVGANLGIVSLILAKRFPLRIIHAFEPAPSTFDAFKTNIALNSCRNIRALRSVVTDRDGFISFNADPASRGTNSIAYAGNWVVELPSITLDTYAEKNSLQEIAFLKIDVEGFEASVLQGARNLLDRQRVAVVYYEVCPRTSKNSGLEPQLATQVLQQHGYQICRIHGSGTLEPATLSEVKSTVVDNWVAVRP